jgi:hypothetical protein
MQAAVGWGTGITAVMQKTGLRQIIEVEDGNKGFAGAVWFRG